MIQEHKKANPWVKREIDHMADLTEEEFKQFFTSGLKLKAPHHVKPKLGEPEVGMEVPDSVDWNAMGKVSVP